MRCGDQQFSEYSKHTFICGLVQTRNAKARPQITPHLKVEGVLPRPSTPPKVKLAGYKGERLRRVRG